MSDVTVNGALVTRLSVTLPALGIWTADATLATSTPLTGRVTIKAGNLTLSGTVIRSGDVSGSRSARIVGGAAGWRKPIASRGYASPAGVRIETVLGDAAKDCGETLASPSGILGTHYVRERAEASRTLTMILGHAWYVDAAGHTQTKERDNSFVTTPFSVIARHGFEGSFEIATEDLASWQPGRKFTYVESLQISSVTIEVSGGKFRLFVTTTEDRGDRLKRDIQAMIRSEIASLTYHAIWEYTVVVGTPGKVDATASDSRMPSVTQCPLMPSLLGESVTLAPGETVYVSFIGGDPSKPMVVGAKGTPLMSAVDAQITVRLGVGARPAIGAGDLAGIFPCIPTQVKVLI